MSKWDDFLAKTAAKSGLVPSKRQRLAQSKKPVIYFAGKIGRNDWRQEIFPGRTFRNFVDACEYDGRLLDPSFVLEDVYFVYAGPFFIACDHGCYHGPNSHGVGMTSDGCNSGPFPDEDVRHRRALIFKVNRERVMRADYVFAYIESADCYGTLIELGMASARGIPTVIGFAPELSPSDRDDLWMAAQTGHVCQPGSAFKCWNEFQGKFLL